MLTGDDLWRWIVRVVGMVGLLYGSFIDKSVPNSTLIIFAAMIGVTEFIRRRNGA